MRSNLFPIAILLFLLTACGSKKTALSYSEKLVAIEKSLVPDVTETENKVGEFFASSQYDSIIAVSQRMEDKIDVKIKEVEKMDTPKLEEAENFKKAFINFFIYTKSVYSSYKNYGMQTNDEDRETARVKMVETIKEKQSIINELQRVQAKFAKANGFRIE